MGYTFRKCQVKSGSVATNAPVISGNSTLAFDVELNMPGEFYEFTVDVVNEGSIDAMIDLVVKTPELTSAQEKYIKYEITYQNGKGNAGAYVTLEFIAGKLSAKFQIGLE